MINKLIIACEERNRDIEMCRDIFELIKMENEEGLKYLPRFQQLLLDQASDCQNRKFVNVFAQFIELHKQTYVWASKYKFECFIMAMEYDRDIDKQFYQPRKLRLKSLVDELQRLADGELDLLCISLPPGVGKTTIAIFFIMWLIGKKPEDPILCGSHSTGLMRGVYDECVRFSTDSEYNWRQVFADTPLVRTNAQDLTLDYVTEKRFSSLQFTSVGKGNAGRLRCVQLLYCDDLCSGIEEAMNRERLDKLWEKYTIDLKQRKLGTCPELHIATRWSNHDVIGRLQLTNENNPRAKFLVFPALNENDESNFDYDYGIGFTTENFHALRDAMDDISWRALYLNQPIEREGLLYVSDELRRYLTLPNEEPDAILAICDTKDTGTDYGFLPIIYQYGNDYYVVDCVCTNALSSFTEAQLAQKLMEHNVHLARFESNNSGGKIADNVQKVLQENGARTKIYKKYTTGNKETRIVVNSPWVISRCIFKDFSLYRSKDEYGLMMRFLTTFTMTRKNPHDDVPDGFGMLAEFVATLRQGEVKVFQRPF